MKKRSVSTNKKQIETKHDLIRLVIVSVVVMALGSCIAIYKRPTSVHANAPARNTNEAAAPAAANTAISDTKTSAPEMKEVVFEPTVTNTAAAPAKSPQGMVWIAGGEFSMGAQDPPDMDDVGMKATIDSRPVHRVYVDGFFMDKTDITNAQFSAFVKATGYITIAEKTPTPEDYPGAPPENLYAGGVVFSPPNHPVDLNNHYQWWSYVKGANCAIRPARRVPSR